MMKIISLKAAHRADIPSPDCILDQALSIWLIPVRRFAVWKPLLVILDIYLLPTDLQQAQVSDFARIASCRKPSPGEVRKLENTFKAPAARFSSTVRLFPRPCALPAEPMELLLRDYSTRCGE